MGPVIKVENLGKKYILRHQRQDSYSTLRDVLTRKALSLFSSHTDGRIYSSKEEFWALKDVSLEVNQGDRIGIIGRNGAGKSTLLKLLSRITEPTRGKISIKGRVASLLEVGTGFHPELTGRENIFLNGSILGMSKIEIKNNFDEIVAFAEVDKFLDTPVKRYSSGMYVRLAFSVAAHLEPEILIVDEVLSVGDVQFQRKCLGKMEDVSKNQGRTVLFVSHNMEMIQKLCTSGILLHRGEMQASGEKDKVVNKYLETGAASKCIYELKPPANADDIPGFVYRIQIENENGNPISETLIGKSWQVRIFIKLQKKAEHFIVGLGIVTSMEVPLRTSWSEAKNYDEGEYEVIFKNNDIMLAPGEYKLTIGLSSYQRAFQYLADTARITISEASSMADNNRVLNSQSGLLINPMEIVIKTK